MGFWEGARARLVTPDAVYGTILYAALIAAISGDDDNTFEVLLWSAVTLIVFWGAHVFAGVLAGHGRERALGHAVRRSFADSSGMLYASIPPTVPLVLGAFGVMTTEDAVDLSLLVATVLLGIIGATALAERGWRWYACVLGGIGTALFGAIMILLNALVH
jgi:hypothetical protein